MQATSKELYANVVSNTGKDPALIKSIGDAVFYRLFTFFKYPESLICKLKGVGFWYMRKKKLNEYIHRWDSYYMMEPPPAYEDLKQMREYENNRRQFNILIERQKQYELYLKKKLEIRAIRYKTQPIQKPKTEEEC